MYNKNENRYSMQKDQMKHVLFRQFIIAILAIGILGCLIYISRAQLDNQSAALVSIILTLLSIVASYIASQYFAEKGHKEALEEVKAQHVDNLKTYAINAAEKVDNLSKELHRLTNFLEDELEKEYDDVLQGFRSRTEKIDSAIHIVETLKSVNDTSLSDWRGVIPEELEEKDEEQLERETELKELIDRVEDLTLMNAKAKKEGETIVTDRIDELRQQLIDVSRRIDGVRIRPKKASNIPLQESVSTPCPNCKKEITYRQRPMKTSFKAVMCPACGEKYTARWHTDKGFVLEPNVLKEENIGCPACENLFQAQVPSLVYSTVQTTCPKCNAILKITRNTKDIKAKRTSAPKSAVAYPELSEEIIQEVQKAMPPQPWPKGTHKNVIETLGTSREVFNRAVQELIRRGVFHPQVDGKIYYTKDEIVK
jgi:hypothetical protein